jgi:hypothetical protein
MCIMIDKEIVEQANLCRNELQCMSGDKVFLCKVATPLGSDIVEIKSKHVRSCSYCLTVGSSYYCHCPVRNEIYRKYRI